MSHIGQKEKGYSMEALYKELGTTRQNIAQLSKRDCLRKSKEERVIEIVKEWRKIHPRIGSRSLYHTIQNIGGIDLELGITKFEQLMSREGLTIKSGLKKWIKTSDGLGKGYYSNLTNGIVLTNINELIVGDITYYRINDQWSYIFTLKDIYSQRILSLVPAQSLEAKHGIKCLTEALIQRNRKEMKNCIHHTDNGSQYNARNYLEILRNVGMQISRANNCLENGSSENLNNIIKNMYLAPWNITTFKELQQACKELIYINNEQRAIEQLGNLSVVQFEQLIKEIPINERPIKTMYDFRD